MVDKKHGFQIFANILLSLMSICCIAPFVLLILSSITEEKSLVANGYSFIPKEISFSAYTFLLSDSGSILNAYGISALVTVLGTLGNLLLTTMYAYPLSRKDLPGRNFFAFFLFFTMLFSGGLVPAYIMWTQTFHIQNKLLALLVPNLLMGAFNVIMMRTYFTSNIPDSVIEAARIDGAGELRILFKVVLPMALPIMATVGLLVGLAYWNDWTNGLYYVNDDRLYSVQVLLTNILRNIDMLKQSAASGGSVFVGQMPSSAIRMAIAVMGVLPVLIIYPFLQRYFIQGIAIGAVKG